jgi:hypothetical protein
MSDPERVMNVFDSLAGAHGTGVTPKYLQRWLADRIVSRGSADRLREWVRGSAARRNRPLQGRSDAHVLIEDNFEDFLRSGVAVTYRDYERLYDSGGISDQELRRGLTDSVVEIVAPKGQLLEVEAIRSKLAELREMPVAESPADCVG